VHGDPIREHGGGSLTGDSEGKIKRDLLVHISLCGSPVGEPGRDSLAGSF